MIKDTHEKDLDRLVEHRQALGKKIRDIAMVERKIDEIPSRSELQQYQLQLVELYEQVSFKKLLIYHICLILFCRLLLNSQKPGNIITIIILLTQH